MTNADVQQVITTAAGRGIKLSEYEAATYLGAREILARNADDKNALKVVENFTMYMASGVKPISFAEFCLPIPETDEEIAAQNERRDAYLRAAGQVAQP